MHHHPTHFGAKCRSLPPSVAGGGPTTISTSSTIAHGWLLTVVLSCLGSCIALLSFLMCSNHMLAHRSNNNNNAKTMIVLVGAGDHVISTRTKLFDQLEAFFELRDDTEWRLAKTRHNNNNNVGQSATSSGRRSPTLKRHLTTRSPPIDRIDSASKTGIGNLVNTGHSILVDTGHSDVDGGHFDCRTVQSMIPSTSFLASGWTKAVYKAEHGGRRYALKTVDLNGQDVGQCLSDQRMKKKNLHINNNLTSSSNLTENDHDDHNNMVDFCYEKAAKKIVKEIALLSQMRHPNVIQVFGYCIPKRLKVTDGQPRVTIVTELGEPVNLIHLLQLNWEDRLRIVLSLAKLLHYLTNTHLGSIVMNDMRRQQFVLVRGELKLVDVDDIGLEEPECSSDKDCANLMHALYNVSAESSAISAAAMEKPRKNSAVELRCIKSMCIGFNEGKNIFNTARHFTTYLLPYGAPVLLQRQVLELIDSFRDPTMSAANLLLAVKQLTAAYSSGAYFRPSNQKRTRYRKIAESDMSGLHDYSCHGSGAQTTCSLSVASPQEAEALCTHQPICRAFVWTKQKTWTGRNLVFFKNNVSTANHNPNTILYLKV